MRIQITASLSDEDDVYLIESVVGGLHIRIYGSSDLTVHTCIATSSCLLHY